MRIFGLDFTSAPSKKKPLALATCTFEGNRLLVEQIEQLPTFDDLEAFLAREGPWVAGFDFAFGQPLKLIQNLEFPDSWTEYVELVTAMDKKDWVSMVDAYSRPRDKGDKLHFRFTDRLAGAQSPMTMYFIPVGRMFYEGTKRLLASDVSILPNRPRDDDRIALEVYPALVKRKFVGRNNPYKSDNKHKQTLETRHTREAIVSGIRDECQIHYGFSLLMPDTIANYMIADATGDYMDAVLAAVQAAWAYTMRDQNYGIPEDVNPLEGWIIDPELLEKFNA